MSPTMQMTASSVTYTPTSDAVDRHEYGVSKNRKVTSTGGGRAWSEDEEVYLLQTRLQKMPYKHIAAHLKKTELACRLHYHQLSHGSNRRKRTTSVSSGSSTGGHSPTMQTSIPSPIHEHDGGASRSCSPPGSAGSYGVTSSPNGIQLPSIMTGGSTNTSPRLPTILPKPASMTLALATATGTGSPAASRGYPTPLSEPHPHSAPLMTPSGYRSAVTPTSAAPPHSAHTSNGAAPHHVPGPLRLDCSALPPPPPSAGLPGSAYIAHHPVDMGRLAAVYNAHRASFWASIAAEYGGGANPVVLEQAWRGTPSSAASSASSLGIAAQTPITPVGSPDDHIYGTQGKSDKTRISAILGIDANPRSPREREMVRRLEEERCSVGVVGA
ncbi:hypothetical protein QBC37DRAFT_125482 [Rhypophila decipiens]|uniref:Myb-like domain-containing protein n=1 Tax=Rhypophila decipiens TaxID=261697 RepID=A0AAN6YCL3_9PEZI|nr:hypothetical protein QBC37DRAFT_125482 [Rhypophila decipiens]